MDYLELAQQALTARNQRHEAQDRQDQSGGPARDSETCEISEICEIRSGEETDPGVKRSGGDPIFRTDLRNKGEIRSEQDAPVIGEDDPVVTWRVAAMRKQVPQEGAIGFLLARPELADRWRELGRDHCHSCGDTLPEGHIVGIAPRCPWCQRAAELACNTVREGMTREP